MTKSLSNSLVLLVVCGVLLLGAAACGGGAEVQSEVSTATVGQQLMDLKKAYEAGALSKDEYEKERKKILDRK